MHTNTTSKIGRKINRKISRLAVVGSVVAGMIGTAMAAPLEELVVVAQRKAENLQQVPLSVSALSESTIEKQGINNLESMALQVPGLSFSPFSPGQNIVSLRGASSNDDGAGTDNSVAMFVDDVYLGRVSNINPELFDLERVEVLRGPQGTLYGKNTIGGAINVITLKPNMDQRTAKVRLSAGNYNSRDFAAYVTGPLSDNCAGKFTISQRSRDGWVTNRSLNIKQKDNDASGLRAQLLCTVNRLEILVSADQNELDVSDMARTPADSNYNGDGANPAAFRSGYESVCGPSGNSKCSAGTIDGYAKRDASGVSSKLTWDIDGNLELVSITAFRNSDSDWNMDSTGSPNLALIDDILDETDQFSQELRLTGDYGIMDFVLGVWYLMEETDRSECFDLTLDTDCSITSRDADGKLVNHQGEAANTDYYRQVNETESQAIFGQINFNLTDALVLTVGARYTTEKKTIDNYAIAGNFVIINEDFELSLSESWNAFTPRVSLNYAVDEDINLYATYSEGFKSGGFPAAPTNLGGTEPLDPETAESLEVGIKSQWLEDRLRFNASLYSVQYSDLQYQNFGPLPENPNFGQFRTFNAGEASVEGAEIELVYATDKDAYISAFVSTAKSSFDKIPADVPVPLIQAQQGQSLLRTPELKYGINYDSYIDLGDGTLELNVNHTFSDDQRADLLPYAIQHAHSLTNMNITWEKGSSRVGFWVKNLGNKEYVSHLYSIARSVTAVYGDPRMMGISYTYEN